AAGSLSAYAHCRPLPVAGRAVGDRADPVALLQLAAELALRSLRPPAHGRHLVQGSQVTLGLAMAVEAPAHGQRRDLVHARHPVHAPVARLAADPFPHMDRMIEVDEARELIDTAPGDGCVRRV